MLTVYTIEQSDEWDSVVRTFADYDVYYLSGYVKAFQIHGDGEPLLFYYEGENIRGINVVMKRDIAKDTHFIGKLEDNTYFDFSTPYGYGGWLIEGINTEFLFAEYEKCCRENGIVSEFVRFHPVIKNHISAGDAYEVVPMGEVVTMDLSSPEIIWRNFISKNRNVIRKAQKNGVQIYNGRYPEVYKQFVKIYNGTMDNDHASKYYYFEDEFYESVLNDLPNNAQVFYAVYQNQIIAASIVISANGKMNYHLSGSLREYSHLAATNLLLYKVALWGCENGCKSFCLGGGVGSNRDSLFSFKKAFYREENLNRFLIGKKVFDSSKYSELVKMRNMEKSEDFFPKYRA